MALKWSQNCHMPLSCAGPYRRLVTMLRPLPLQSQPCRIMLCSVGQQLSPSIFEPSAVLASDSLLPEAQMHARVAFTCLAYCWHVHSHLQNWTASTQMQIAEATALLSLYRALDRGQQFPLLLTLPVGCSCRCSDSLRAHPAANTRLVPAILRSHRAPTSSFRHRPYLNHGRAAPAGISGQVAGQV